MTKFEWASNHHRDSIASHIGHHDMLTYFAVAQNDAVGRVRYQLLEVTSLLFCLKTFKLTIENPATMRTPSS